MREEASFPEGAESGATGAVAPKGGKTGGGAIPDEAFFSPDDPITQAEGDIPDDAIFSPDEPLIRSDEGEGVVVGMGGGDDRDYRKGKGLAWEIRNTSAIMESLAKELNEKGMEALRVHPDTVPMDAMLRSYVAGYLVGRLDGEE
jgi:hypothetical protein